MKKLLLGITCMLMVLGLIFSAECGKQPTSPASDRLEARNNGTAIQWKYSDETDWHDLVALDELRGAAGENGKDGKDGADGKNGKDGINGTNSKDGINGFDGKDGADGKNGKDGIDGINGKDGIDGKSIEVQRAVCVFLEVAKDLERKSFVIYIVGNVHEAVRICSRFRSS